METKKLKDIELSHFETSPELAEVKVIYKSKNRARVKISDSKDVVNILYPLYDRDTIEYQEQFYLLLLNRANVVLGWIRISAGGITGTVVDPRMILVLALKTNAINIILSHNHPSGNMKPSESDIMMTKKINEAGKLLEIKLLDHIIIGPDQTFYSFADEGVLF